MFFCGIYLFLPSRTLSVFQTLVMVLVKTLVLEFPDSMVLGGKGDYVLDDGR